MKKNFCSFNCLMPCLVSTIALLTSCISHESCPEYDSIQTYAKKYAKEEGWQLVSIGAFGKKGYSGPHFNIVYRGRDIFDIEEARDLIVRNILNFIEENANNQELVQKVDKKNGQFSYRNIELLLSFYHENYKRNHGAISLVSSSENRIRYWRYDIDKKDQILVHTESINEAFCLSPECKDKSILFEDPDFAYQSSSSNEEEKPKDKPVILIVN